MPNIGSGLTPKRRAWCLLEALLLQAEEEAKGEPAYQNITIRRINWDTASIGNPTLEIENTTPEKLSELIKKQKLNEYNSLSINKDRVTEILNYSLSNNPLKIYEECRESVRGAGSENRHFRLKLWSTDIQENKVQFEENWQNSKRKMSNTSQASNHYPSTSIPCWAYDDNWVGRKELITELSAKIHGSCRILMLVGITGIGKTALAERLSLEFQRDLTKIDRKNFDDQEQPSDFASVASDLLIRWGETVTFDDRKDVQRLLYRLARHLRENRYLLLIDSLESILEGDDEKGWSDFKDEWWLRFLRHLLTIEDSFQSCIIITSQDLPRQLEQERFKYPNWLYIQLLSGLSESEQLNLFNKVIGLDISKDSLDKTYLVRIGKAYQGHPLALRVILGEIENEPFNGSIEAYWNEYGHEIEEVEKAIEESKTISSSADDNPRLERYSRDLRNSVKARLEKSLNRLRNGAYYSYMLLCEVSVYRCAVKEAWWLNHIEEWDLPKNWNKDKSQEVLDGLFDRNLVEVENINNKVYLKLHNLIRSIALAHYKELSWDDEQFSNV